MKENKIVLKGQEYAAPKTESVEIINQGVLCASGASGSSKFSIGAGSFLMTDTDFLQAAV